jgi:hypothetical protein
LEQSRGPRRLDQPDKPHHCGGINTVSFASEESPSTIARARPLADQLIVSGPVAWPDAITNALRYGYE